MHKLSIRGGIPLMGALPISGSKNSVLPILFSSLLASEPILIENVPNLRDVETTLALLSHLGLGVQDQRSTHSVYITPLLSSPEQVDRRAPYDLVKTMRASILVLGPLLTRYGRAKVSMPGGCAIGMRPVDMHIQAFEKMGASIAIQNGYIVGEAPHGLKGSTILFDKVTVTGTENVLMAATLAHGTTVIQNAAKEPEITDLVCFLRSLGAKIEGEGTSCLTIQGVSELGGHPKYRVSPDRIEAGTFLAAALITQGCIKVEGVQPGLMDAVLLKLEEAGAHIQVGSDWIQADMRHDRPSAVNIETAPYPGFPTDMQAQLMAVNVVAKGIGVIKETIFENRFMHVQELRRLGADIKVEGNIAVSQGVEQLTGAPLLATDLRASASLVLAGLAAEGYTEIDRVYHIDRGYEDIDKKCQAVGGRVHRLLL